MDNYEIYHHGVKGQKWGVRRYQNKDGSLTARGKKRLGIGDSISGYLKKRHAESVKKKAAAEKQKAEDEQRKKVEDVETKKAAVLKSRSAKALYENADLFTTEELRTAKARLELEQSIGKLDMDRVTSGDKFASEFIKKSANFTNMVDSGSKMYNNVAKVYNALYGNAHGKSLSLISDKVVSAVDKMKDETERMKAKVEYDKAKKDYLGQKTDLERMKEETERLKAENENREAKRKASDKQRETDDLSDETKNINAKNANYTAKKKYYENAQEFAEKYGSQTVNNSSSDGPIDVTPSSSPSSPSSPMSPSMISSGQNEVRRLLSSPSFTMIGWKNPED